MPPTNTGQGAGGAGLVMMASSRDFSASNHKASVDVSPASAGLANVSCRVNNNYCRV